MTVLTRIGNVEAVGLIENGCLFRYKFDYYIATDNNDKENCRICVDVESGELTPIPTAIVVETFVNATIDLLGKR